MKTVAQLRKERAAAIDLMKAMLEEADTRADAGMTEEEEARYADLQDEVRRLDVENERRMELTGLLEDLDEPPAGRERRYMDGQAPAHHRQTRDTAEAIFCRHLRIKSLHRFLPSSTPRRSLRVE